MSDIKCSVQGVEFRLAVDAIVHWQGGVVLVKRKYPPYSGSWVLPGGIVGVGETLEEAVEREVREETGCKCLVDGLVGVYSTLDRDPRGRTVSVCFVCKAKNPPVKKTGEASEVRVFPLDALPELGFDHEQMMKDLTSKATTESG